MGHAGRREGLAVPGQQALSGETPAGGTQQVQQERPG